MTVVMPSTLNCEATLFASSRLMVYIGMSDCEATSSKTGLNFRQAGQFGLQRSRIARGADMATEGSVIACAAPRRARPERYGTRFTDGRTSGTSPRNAPEYLRTGAPLRRRAS